MGCFAEQKTEQLSRQTEERMTSTAFGGRLRNVRQILVFVSLHDIE